MHPTAGSARDRKEEIILGGVVSHKALNAQCDVRAAVDEGRHSQVTLNREQPALR
jgi:hypothetical protein